jgi:hypothetical protein
MTTPPPPISPFGPELVDQARETIRRSRAVAVVSRALHESARASRADAAAVMAHSRTLRASGTARDRAGR